MNVKAGAFCALVMMASPAAAEPWAVYGPGSYGSGPYGPRGYGPASLSPYQIHATLRANGLRPLTRPVQSGPYIVVRAVDSYGDVVRVLLNARYGNIVSVAPLPPAPVVGDRLYRPYYPYRAYEPYPRYGAVGPAVRPDLKSEPPSSLPNAPYAAVPNAQEHRSAAVTPARPPMPRPRPAIPATTAAARAGSEAVETTGTVPATGATTAPTSASATTAAAPNRPGAQSFPPAAPLE